MSDHEELNLIQSFLAVGRGSPAGETAAWDDFYHAHDPMLQDVVRRYSSCWAELDDLIQQVWKVLISELRDFQLDPARGPLLRLGGHGRAPCGGQGGSAACQRTERTCWRRNRPPRCSICARGLRPSSSVRWIENNGTPSLRGLRKTCQR